MTSNRRLLTDYCKFDVPETVKLGDGHSVEALGCGRVRISVETSRGKKATMMGGVLYVLKLACNLFSVRAVTQKGQIVQFGQPCVNGDWLCQWERAIFDPPQNPQPLTDHQKICC